MAESQLITLPKQDVYRAWHARNLIVQLAEPGGQMEVIYEETVGKALAFRDENGRRLLIYPPRVKAESPAHLYKLRAKSAIHTVADINIDTEFVWLNHAGDFWATEPDEIVAAWANVFRFVQDDPDKGWLGLREPQLGAIHA